MKACANAVVGGSTVAVRGQTSRCCCCHGGGHGGPGIRRGVHSEQAVQKGKHQRRTVLPRGPVPPVLTLLCVSAGKVRVSGEVERLVVQVSSC